MCQSGRLLQVPRLPSLCAYTSITLVPPPLLLPADGVPAFNLFGLQRLLNDLGGIRCGVVRCMMEYGVESQPCTLRPP